MRFFDEVLKRFARSLSKGSHVLGDRFSVFVFLVTLPALLALAVAVGFLFPTFFHEYTSFQARPFAQDIKGEDWLVAYVDDESAIWREGKPREMYAHSQELDRRHGKTYWIGVEISKEQLAVAKAQDADQFFIGYLLGSWEVYVESKLVGRGHGQGYRRPTVIAIPPAVLERGEAFRVSIRIRHDMMEMYPEVLFFSGLASSEQIERHMRWSEFYSMIANSTAMGIGLAFGFFFLALWAAGVRKQELAAFAAFGVLQTAIQAMTISLVLEDLGAPVSYRLNFILRFYEVLCVIWLGLSIARVRSSRVLWTMTTALILPWLVFFTKLTPNQIFHGTWFIGRWFSPNSYLFAALICFSQARLVGAVFRQELLDGSRVSKLYFTSAILVVMWVVHLYGNEIYFDSRVLNSLLVMGLAAVVVHDYRRQEIFVRRSPVSSFHQRATMPEQIVCTLVAIDLKQSESLYRYGSEHGIGGALVVEIMSKAMKVVTESGGEVIQMEGDALLFFLESQDRTLQLERTFLILAKIEEVTLRHLEDERRKRGVEFPTDIRIRAAADVGVIRPIWQGSGGREVAGWEQTGNSNVFVDVARLMDIEAKSVSKSQSSLIVKTETIREPILSWQEISVRSEVETKHGRRLDVTWGPLSVPQGRLRAGA